MTTWQLSIILSDPTKCSSPVSLCQYDPSMGDVEEADYESGLHGVPTELAPSADVTSAQTAWALDDGPEWKPPFWTPVKVTTIAVSLAVVSAVVVAGLVGYHLNDDPPATPPPTMAAPTSVQPIFIPTTTTPRPRSGGWVVSPNNPMEISHGNYSDAQMLSFDDRFIARLRAGGWVVTAPGFLAAVGKGVCTSYARNISMSDVTETLRGRYSAADSDSLVAAAQIVYPDCIAPS